MPDGVMCIMVQLYFFEELTLHEISAKIGLTYEQTKERYRRGMRRLEQMLARLK